MGDAAWRQEIADAIRNLLLAHYDESMSSDTELLLMLQPRKILRA
jgi:hypothetical protein